MLLEERKRQPENDDIYLVRRRNSEHIDDSVRIIRSTSVD